MHACLTEQVEKPNFLVTAHFLWDPLDEFLDTSKHGPMTFLHVAKHEIVLMIINIDQNNDQLNSLLTVVRGLHNFIKSIKWSNRVDKYILYYFLSLIF